MKRKVTGIGRLSEDKSDGFVPGSHGDRISLVWPLTMEAAALSKNHNVEQRLQRNVTLVKRRES